MARVLLIVYQVTVKSDKNQHGYFKFDEMDVTAMADNKEDEGGNKGGNGTMKIVIVAVVLSIVLSGGIAGGLVFMLGGDVRSNPCP